VHFRCEMPHKVRLQTSKAWVSWRRVFWTGHCSNASVIFRSFQYFNIYLTRLIIISKNKSGPCNDRALNKWPNLGYIFRSVASVSDKIACACIGWWGKGRGPAGGDFGLLVCCLSLILSCGDKCQLLCCRPRPATPPGVLLLRLRCVLK